MNKAISIRLDENTLALLKGRSRENFRTVGAEARYLIEAGLRSLAAEDCTQARELAAAMTEARG